MIKSTAKLFNKPVVNVSVDIAYFPMTQFHQTEMLKQAARL